MEIDVNDTDLYVVDGFNHGKRRWEFPLDFFFCYNSGVSVCGKKIVLFLILKKRHCPVESLPN